MNEINKFGVNNSPAFGKANVSYDAEVASQSVNEEMRDYREAVGAPAAENAGRAQINVDNINSDMNLILNNPELLDKSEALFDAAEFAGVPYPVAATFATQEVRA